VDAPRPIIHYNSSLFVSMKAGSCLGWRITLQLQRLFDDIASRVAADLQTAVYDRLDSARRQTKGGFGTGKGRTGKRL
jgi:hypothetical protein